jgi:hypothetical protein
VIFVIDSVLKCRGDTTGVSWRGREVSAPAIPGDTEGNVVQRDYRGVLGLGASPLVKRGTSRDIV